MSKWEGRLIFHVDADAFFASVEQVTNPLLRGKPVVICGLPLNHGVVTAASYEARPFGIKAGMANVEARRRLPKGKFIPVNIPKYLYFSVKLLSIYLRLTPRVEAYSVDEVFMELTDLPGNPVEIAAAIKARVKEGTGLTVSVGIGPNKLVAKIASDFRKPDGLTVVCPEEVAQFLNPLELERCPGVGIKTVEVLKKLGIETFAQLATIPLPKLRYLFGKNGEKLYWAARGIDLTPVIPLDQLPPLKSKGHEITFDEPIFSVEKVRGVIWEIAGRIGFTLRDKQLLATGVRLKLKLESGKVISSQCQLRCTTWEEQLIAEAAYQLYSKRYAGQSLRGLGICGIGLIASQDSPQIPLFGAETEHSDLLQPVLDQLKRKYGEGIIVPAVNLLNRNSK